jgi:two-component system, NtrC family, response regulator
MVVESLNPQESIIVGYENIKMLAQQLAQLDFNILLEGESGVGKNLFAEYIHTHSSRCNQPFYVLPCTSLPATLIDTMLFGHKKGCFTDAHEDNSGIIEDAHGGIIFLDER